MLESEVRGKNGMGGSIRGPARFNQIKGNVKSEIPTVPRSSILEPEKQEIPQVFFDAFRKSA